MDIAMELSDYRAQIDRIDAELLRLFAERMQTAAGIASYKKAHGLPVLDAGREREKLAQIVKTAPEELQEEAVSLYRLLFSLSRSYQHDLLDEKTALPALLKTALENTPQLFPPTAAVACQGVEGAYSQQACDKLFQHPSVFFCATFDKVFSAIEQGLCQYGVLPLENSTAGSVNAVYDLMQKHNFSIVRSVRLRVDHSLLTLPGVKLSDIHEIVSHGQALEQCSEFLKQLPNVTVTRCENTAAAARMVAESGRRDLAAIASPACAEIYGLQPLQERVQNEHGNYTRFICIAAKPEVYPGADRTSLLVTLSNEPGSLYQVLARIYGRGINLTKLESHPRLGRYVPVLLRPRSVRLLPGAAEAPRRAGICLRTRLLPRQLFGDCVRLPDMQKPPLAAPRAGRGGFIFEENAGGGLLQISECC